MRLFAMALATILAMQTAQAATNETGYRLFNDSQGELILEMFNNNRTIYDEGTETYTKLPGIYYYIPYDEWTRTSNIYNSTTNEVTWKESVDMGAGYLPAGEQWNGTNMVSYWIRDFTNWQRGVYTDNDHLTYAWANGTRTIQGRTITLYKMNYLTNDSFTMLMNESLTSSGSTPVLYALYRHFNFSFPNPVWRAKLNGTWTNIPIGAGIHQLYRGTDIDLQDSILGELLPDGQLGFQIRMRPMDNGRYPYFVYVNDSEVYEVVRLGQFNASSTIATTRGWQDAICSATPGCSVQSVQQRLNGVSADLSPVEVGNNFAMECRFVAASPCNFDGAACYIDWLRLFGLTLGGAAEEMYFFAPDDPTVGGGYHFYSSCNDTSGVGYSCEKLVPADNTWYYGENPAVRIACTGNTTAITSGTVLNNKRGMRDRCVLVTTAWGTIYSVAYWHNCTDTAPPSEVVQVFPENDTTVCPAGNVTHHCGFSNATIKLWDAGYLDKVIFMLYNSSENNIENYTYNCSPWRSTGATRGTWDFVTPFSTHDCITLDATFGIISYPNFTRNMGVYGNNTRYNWSVNASDMGGRDYTGTLPPNWKLSTSNFTYLYKTFCEIPQNYDPEQYRDIDDDDEFLKSDSALLLAVGLMIIGISFISLMDTRGDRNAS